MNGRLDPHPVLKIIAKDATLSLLAEALVLVSFFLFYRLLADFFSSEAVGIYSLMRRVLALLIPIVILGLAEALGRYIAAAEGQSEKSALVTNSGLILTAALTVAAVVLNFYPAVCAKWVFGNESYKDMMSAFTVTLAGFCFNTFTYSSLRGNLQIKTLNLLQIINLGVVPIAVILIARGGGLPTVLACIGGLQCVTAVAFLALLKNFRPRLEDVSADTLLKLLRFGALRVPATLAGAGLISIAPIVASHYVSMTEISYLSLSLALLIGVGGALSPLGSVLLPHLSGLAGKGQLEEFEKHLYLLFGGVVHCLLFLTFQFILFADYVLDIWMGSAFRPAAPILISVFFSLLGYGFYVVARNVLDAVGLKPSNSINSFFALLFLVILLVAVAVSSSAENMLYRFALAFSFSYNLLAYLTYRSLRQIFPSNANQLWRHLKWGLVLNVGIGVCALIAKAYVSRYLAGFIAFEIALFGLYCWAITRLQFEWSVVLVNALRRKWS